MIPVKNYLPCISIALLFCINLHSQTVIPDSTFLSGRLTLENSPYQFNGIAIIPEGDTLIIDPGVELQFKTGEQTSYASPDFDMGFLYIKGLLVANGTSSDRIIFTRQGSEGNWGCLAFSDLTYNTSSLSYCKIAYASRVLDVDGYPSYYGAVSDHSNDLIVEHCEIFNNNNHGISTYRSDIVIKNSIISNNNGDGIAVYNDPAEIVNNTIIGNSNNGVGDYSAGSTIKNCIFYNNDKSFETSFEKDSPRITFCLIQEEEMPDDNKGNGEGVIFGMNPHLNADHTLSFNSPCINSGTPDTLGLGVGKDDYYSEERVSLGRIDMGATEYTGSGVISLLSPNGYERWWSNSSREITWQGNASSVKLEYSADNGIVWNTITESTDNDGSYMWTLPSVQTDKCLVRVSDVTDPAISDIGDNAFIILKSVIPDSTFLKGRLTLENSPYKVNGIAIVPEGDTLIIDPGVELQFKTGTNSFYGSTFDKGFLYIKGLLIAEGTSSQRIVFTRQDSIGNWGCLVYHYLADDSPNLRYCKIEYAGQVRDLEGYYAYSGAVYDRFNDLKIEHCEILNNKCDGICSAGSDILVRNSIISNNYGNGIAAFNGSPEIINNTIICNSDNGIDDNNAGSTIKNCIFYDNNKSFNATSSTLCPTITYSLIQEEAMPDDNYGHGVGVIYGMDPHLSADYTLTPNSPCINSGTPDTTGLQLGSHDFHDESRVNLGRVDMGASEFSGSDYICLLSPKGYEGWFGNTSREIRWNGSAGTVRLEYSIDYGKVWNGIIESTENDGSHIWSIPSAESGDCLVRVSDVADSAMFDVSASTFSVINSVIPDSTLLKGRLTLENSPYQVNGMAIISEGDTLIIDPGVELQFKTGEQSSYFSPDFDLGFLYIKGFLIANGTATDRITFTRQGDGGNWGCLAFSPRADDNSRLQYCKIEHGYQVYSLESESYKGALSDIQNDLKIEYCEIFNNKRYGIYAYESDIVIKNSVISDNSNGIFVCEGNPEIINNTIVGNSWDGIMDDYAGAIIKNCIFYDNNRRSIGTTSYSTTITYCLIQEEVMPNNTKGDSVGVIFNMNPHFVSYPNHNYHLKPQSPCIDSGDTTDTYENEPLPNGSRINMGAYGNTLEATSFEPLPRIDKVISSGNHVFGYDTVSIIGKYFLHSQNAGRVLFDTSACLSVLFWSDDSIVCISPPHLCDTVDITIINTNGKTGTAEITFIYQNPVIESINPAYSDVIGGDTITIQGSQLSPAQNDTRLFLGSNEVSEYLLWTDTLLKVISPPGDTGFQDLIFMTSEDTLFNLKESFIYTSGNVYEACGDISGIWHEGETYIITCSVEIPSGSVLEIEEGVNIIVQAAKDSADFCFTSKGKLIVNGHHSNPVCFSAIPALEGIWGGVILQGTGTLRNAAIKHGTNGIEISGSAIAIDSCDVSLNSRHGIYFDGNQNYASGVVNNSIISHNGGYGILMDARCYHSSGSLSSEIVRNRVLYNEEGGIKVSSHGSLPYVSYGHRSANATATIQDNWIEQNVGFGIFTNASGRDEEHNRNATTIVSLNQNIISGNEFGIYMNQGWGASDNQIRSVNNVFWNNGEVAIEKDESMLNISNTIIWGNQFQQIINSIDSTLSVSNSNSSQMIEGENNISTDPLFTDPSANDFTLQSSSPCIDAGRNDMNDWESDFENGKRILNARGLDSSIVDMGVYEFISDSASLPVIDFSEKVLEVCNGQPLSLKIDIISATSADIAWYKDGFLIPGKDSSIFDIDSVSISDAGDYYCIVTNDVGTAYSDTAQVNINMPSAGEEDVYICQGDNYYGWYVSGIYERSLCNSYGCDSTITTNLFVSPLYSSTEFIEICEGEFVQIGDSIYTESGNYSMPYLNQYGCDSIVNLDLTVHPVYEVEVIRTICEGESVPIGDSIFTITGQYRVPLVTRNGCDSIINLDLTVNPVYDIELARTICEGEFVQMGDSIFTKTGQYIVPLVTRNGCDSIINLDLTVNPVYDIELARTICEGEFVQIGDSRFTESGHYSMPYLNRYGCDSVIRLDLTVIPVSDFEMIKTICEGESVQIGDSIYTESGLFRLPYVNPNGCDYTIILDMTVNPVPEIPIITLHGNTLSSSNDTGNQWFYKGSPISGATNKVYIVKENGDYQVKTTNGYGCTSISAVYEVTALSRSDLSWGDLRIFPNPTNGKMYIGNLKRELINRISIYDIQGRKLRIKITYKGDLVEINMEKNLEGLYWLEIRTEKGIYNHTIMKTTQ